ncbi:FAD binding domain-containing protein [Gaopeijia maritima]|uniref:FAD binding domain-containing protein n=1 Tax=Gaopeijia maritima TaxID=3119007 RepID=A0ABU9E6G4_9BACT
MLRLPEYRYHRPTRIAEVQALLAEHGAEARVVAGGTDLIPNMKHRLFEPAHLIGLSAVEELRGVTVDDDVLDIGAATTLDELGRNAEVRRHAPALAEAARHVAGPQIRNRGTIGGNLCLDTRCTYYNQTEFWRTALGFCLKKDGDTCHVTRVGKKCVAAHSADTPPVLMVLDAEVDGVGPSGPWTHAVKDLFVADGIHNTRLEAGDVVTRIRVPISAARRCVYRKLRQRQAVDFPLLTVAVAATRVDGGWSDLRGVVTGLGSRPRWISGWDRIFEGGPLDDEGIDELAQRAWAQCHPLENMIVDPEWRRAMVPVEVTRALKELRAREG